MFGTTRLRQMWFLLAIVCGVALLTSLDAPLLWAQEPAEGGGEANPHANQSALMWFIVNSGAIGAFILLLSIYFTSLCFRMYVELRPSVQSPPELQDELDSLVEQRQFKEVYNAVKDDESYLGRVLATGLHELPNGLSEAREAMERVGESITVDMEKKISMMAVLGTLGPMIGLLGTLKGMIASFSVIARSDAGIKASEVAGGISEALLLTFEGVALSVPAIYFFSFFKNRVTNISVNVGLQADEFLRRFAHAARAKAPAAGAAPATQVAAAATKTATK